jgi:hypothetical protein
MRANTKQARILSALEAGDRMTHLKAIAYGTYRLAAVVHRLRALGYTINVDTKTDVNGTRFAEYYMEPEATRLF